MCTLTDGRQNPSPGALAYGRILRSNPRLYMRISRQRVLSSGGFFQRRRSMRLCCCETFGSIAHAHTDQITFFMVCFPPRFLIHEARLIRFSPGPACLRNRSGDTPVYSGAKMLRRILGFGTKPVSIRGSLYRYKRLYYRAE